MAAEATAAASATPKEFWLLAVHARQLWGAAPSLDGDDLCGLHTGLRGAVRAAPAPDPEGAGRPLPGLLVVHRRRLPQGGRAPPGPRSGGGDGVPPDRRHPRRAEDE